MSQLVRILDLVKMEVAGHMADIHSRHADGTYHHASICEKDQQNGTFIGPRELTRVYIRKGKHKGETVEWLMWEWKPDRTNMRDCGYSGFVIGPHSVDDFYLMVGV